MASQECHMWNQRRIKYLLSFLDDKEQAAWKQSHNKMMLGGGMSELLTTVCSQQKDADTVVFYAHDVAARKFMDHVLVKAERAEHDIQTNQDALNSIEEVLRIFFKILVMRANFGFW